MDKKASFNTAAALYDEVRPSYPDEVIDWIIDKTSITLESKLLEIAPGTGQATKKFGERNFTIHCVELGDQLAKLLMENCKNQKVTVDVSSFESWDNHENIIYDMIYCATAFHWLDPEIKYVKCYDLLGADGRLVLLWNGSSDTSNQLINAAYEMMWQHYPERNIIDDIKQLRKEEINRSGVFKLEHHLDFKWLLNEPKDVFIKGFFSQSSYLSLKDDLKEKVKDAVLQLFADLEDEVSTAFSTSVYICKKV